MKNARLDEAQPGIKGEISTTSDMQMTPPLWQKAKKFQENIYFCFTDYSKAFDCVAHNKLWKILKEMKVPDHLICLLKTCVWVEKQQLESDMESD